MKQDLICVSYEARRLGVKKHTVPSLAKAQFPELVLVQTHESHGKVSYNAYREAGERAFDVVRSMLPSTPFCQESIDEACFDLSAEAAERLKRASKGHEPQEWPASLPQCCTQQNPRVPEDNLLVQGCIIANEVREAIFKA